jgi:predicted aldo/keto reductase-like oxidoreductase
VEMDVHVITGPSSMQAELLKGLPPSLDHILATASLPSTATKLLQLVRSTPGVVTTLVGQKQKQHVVDNVALAKEPRLGPKLWALVHKRVLAAFQQRAGVVAPQVGQG